MKSFTLLKKLRLKINMRVTTSQCEAAKIHIGSVKTFSSKAKFTRQRKQFIGKSSILAWGRSCVLPTDPLFFYTLFISTIKYYWSIDHCLLFLLFFNLIFALFLFLFISHYLKKKTVHEPGPKWGPRDPWAMFCPHPNNIGNYNIDLVQAESLRRIWGEGRRLHSFSVFLSIETKG